MSRSREQGDQVITLGRVLGELDKRLRDYALNKNAVGIAVIDALMALDERKSFWENLRLIKQYIGEALAISEYTDTLTQLGIKLGYEGLRRIEIDVGRSLAEEEEE